MRVGILTYHCVPNFGAQLQAMSTVGYLKRMGHTPILLHWYPKDLEALYTRRVPKIQRKCQMQFAETHFPLSSLCRNEKQLIKEIERQQLDMIITGSDALFKYKPICDRERAFSKRRLRFVNNYVSCEDLEGNPFFCGYYGELSRQIPVVAFSVSSQNCPYFRMTEDEREKMGRYLRNFKKITVRDQWTKSMVEEVAGLKNIEITPDPVFAFNQNCYIDIPTKEEILARFSLPEHYALFSFAKGVLPIQYVEEIGRAIKQHGITPIAFAEPEGLGDVFFSDQVDLPLSPIEWYSLIQNADAYIGTRMHPIIVSLHNVVPFYSYDGNGTVDAITGQFNKKSSKIYDILVSAGLEWNTYALNSGEELLETKRIIDKILTFDKSKCKLFSDNMTETYMESFESIICSCR